MKSEPRLYCVRCGTVAVPLVEVSGSLAVEILLWLLFLLPGLIYTFWRHGTNVCPSCYSTELIPLDSPRAVAGMAGLASKGEIQ